MTRLAYLPVLLAACSLAAGEIKNTGWWRNTVFYQIYPRSIMDTNADGDGDLTGITKKLDHFVDAGVGAIWLSPIYESPMVDFGYDISNFRTISSIFGTMEDFQILVQRAKSLGIKVILDLVPNHTSDQHEWFQKSILGEVPYNEYYIWREGTTSADGTLLPPNNWISVFSGPAWTYNEQRKMWYFHQFAEQQPDLNYANAAVKLEMEAIIRFWLEKGVDGFRVDAIPHLFEDDSLPDEPSSGNPDVDPRDYASLNHLYTKDDPRTYEVVKDWRKVLDDYANITNTDEKVMMTEAYTTLDFTIKYYSYGSQIPFNFKFITDVNSGSSATDFKTTIDTWINNMPEGGAANWVMGNHDNSRTASRYPGRADQMTMLAMILPGVAVTYNGEEIAMEDTWISWADTKDPQACNTDEETYEQHTRDPNRTPFQWDDTLNAGFSTSNTTWLPVNANYKVLNLKNQKLASTSHYKVYQALTKLRKSSALQGGSLETAVLNDGKVLAVCRTHADSKEHVVLLINFDDVNKQEVDLSSTIGTDVQDIVVNIASVESLVKEGTSVNPSKVEIPAKAALVLTSGIARGSAFSVTPMNLSALVAITLGLIWRNGW